MRKLTFLAVVLAVCVFAADAKAQFQSFASSSSSFSSSFQSEAVVPPNPTFIPTNQVFVPFAVGGCGAHFSAFAGTGCGAGVRFAAFAGGVGPTVVINNGIGGRRFRGGFHGGFGGGRGGQTIRQRTVIRNR
jgi:hypothetical protein